MKGHGRVIFAAVLLGVGGVLNVIYGIAAISNSKFYTQHANYVFGDLKTWGWVGLILGVLELSAALSLFRGGEFGRIFGIGVGALVALLAIFQLPAHPLWSLAIFGLSLWIVNGLSMAGGPPREEYGEPAMREWPSTQAAVAPRPPA